jgi:hypothetical protein
MDQLMEANIINKKVEEEDCDTCLDGGMTKSDDPPNQVKICIL